MRTSLYEGVSKRLESAVNLDSIVHLASWLSSEMVRLGIDIPQPRKVHIMKLTSEAGKMGEGITFEQRQILKSRLFSIVNEKIQAYIDQEYLRSIGGTAATQNAESA